MHACSHNMIQKQYRKPVENIWTEDAWLIRIQQCSLYRFKYKSGKQHNLVLNELLRSIGLHLLFCMANTTRGWDVYLHFLADDFLNCLYLFNYQYLLIEAYPAMTMSNQCLATSPVDWLNWALYRVKWLILYGLWMLQLHPIVCSTLISKNPQFLGFTVSVLHTVMCYIASGMLITVIVGLIDWTR